MIFFMIAVKCEPKMGQYYPRREIISSPINLKAPQVAQGSSGNLQPAVFFRNGSAWRHDGMSAFTTGIFSCHFKAILLKNLIKMHTSIIIVEL